MHHVHRHSRVVESSTNRQDLVSDLQTAVFVSRPALDDLGDVDAVVSWYVLVSNTSSDAESKSWETS